MSNVGVRVGNNNVRVTLIVSKQNIPVDISTATTKEINLRKPISGTVLTRAGVFTTDGTDGKLYYDLLSADLDEAGLWEVQGKVIITSGTYTTEIASFQVYKNLV